MQHLKVIIMQADRHLLPIYVLVGNTWIILVQLEPAHGYFVLHAVCSACSFVVNGNFILFFWVNGNFIFYFFWVKGLTKSHSTETT
jgi:hypothetical protein